MDTTTLDEIFSCAINWISDDADKPDTAPPAWIEAMAAARANAEQAEQIKKEDRTARRVLAGNVKYYCPECDLTAWAAPSQWLCCGACDFDLSEEN